MSKYRIWSHFGVLLTLMGCGDSRDTNPNPGNGHPQNGPIVVNETYQGQYPIQILCTTGMVADLAKHVGGDRVQVSQLMGAGVDPHLYKASPGDVTKLTDADLIFYSGLHLEGKLSDVLLRMARRKPTFAVTEYMPAERILETAEGSYDPHLWFDVSLWLEGCVVIKDVLSAFDPNHASEYAQRAAEYQKELQTLHELVKTELKQIPSSQRVLVTAHDAFRYFGRAYAIEVRGIQGISTESEAGVKEVNALVDFLVDRKVKAIFVESTVSDKNVQALIEGCRAKGHTIVIGGELFSDAMGADGTAEGTYPGMVRHNLKIIVEALK